MDIFIPQTADELYEKLVSENFTGQLFLEKGLLIWQLPNDITIKVAVSNGPHEGYIEIYSEKPYLATHWHPRTDEIYSDLRDINIGEAFLVKKKRSKHKISWFLIRKNRWESLSERRKSRYIIYPFFD